MFVVLECPCVLFTQVSIADLQIVNKLSNAFNFYEFSLSCVKLNYFISKDNP